MTVPICCNRKNKSNVRVGLPAINLATGECGIISPIPETLGFDWNTFEGRQTKYEFFPSDARPFTKPMSSWVES